MTNVATGTLGRHYTWQTAFGGLPRHELEAARDHLAQVGLAHLGEQRAGTLSGGQKQRVAIARALAQRPRVLLADEPVASLDPEASEEIMRLLQNLARSAKLAVLCVLHQIELAYGYADRVVGIRERARSNSTCRASKCPATACSASTSERRQTRQGNYQEKQHEHRHQRGRRAGGFACFVERAFF